jgi:pimeloyl-ACP methyl ester carboxylesterase
MAAALPDATLVTIPGSGHLTALERPDAVAEALVRFDLGGGVQPR